MVPIGYLNQSQGEKRKGKGTSSDSKWLKNDKPRDDEYKYGGTRVGQRRSSRRGLDYLVPAAP